MKLTFTTFDDILVASISGRLDATISEYTIEKLSTEIDKGYNKLVLDLKNMEYLSSAGIRVLITVTKKINSLSGEIKLVAVQEYPLNVLKISGFLNFFNFFDDLESAKADFLNLQNKKNNKNINVFETEHVRFEFLKNSENSSSLTITGDNQIFLNADCTSENIYSMKISDLQYAFGIGAVAQNKDESLDRLGELMFMKSSAMWIQPGEKNIPDYLSSVENLSEIQVHTPYLVKLEQECNELVRFESKSGKISLDDLCEGLFAILQEKNNSGLVSFVIRADADSIYGASLKKSPIVKNKPENGESITEKDNIRQWLHYNLDASHENSSILIVGVAMNENNLFEDKKLKKIFNFEGNPKKMMHCHGAIFKFIPEDRGSFELHKEIDKVLKNSQLIGMAHLLDNTTLKKGIIGLNYINEIKIKE